MMGQRPFSFIPSVPERIGNMERLCSNRSIGWNKAGTKEQRERDNKMETSSSPRKLDISGFNEAMLRLIEALEHEYGLDLSEVRERLKSPIDGAPMYTFSTTRGEETDVERRGSALRPGS